MNFAAVEACKLHVITAIEFYKDGKSVKGRNSVPEMLYPSKYSDPIATLHQQLEMALASEKMLEELAPEHHKFGSQKSDEIAKKQNPAPVSLCRWFHIPTNNVSFLLKINTPNANG